jgi:hypothetical protein
MEGIIFEKIWQNYQENPFVLIDETTEVTLADCKELMKKYGARVLVLCDVAVVGIESFGELRDYGFLYEFEGGTLINIDHHAPVLEFERHISSTNLALRYIRVHGTVVPDVLVMINHTDYDAIVSASLVKGVLGQISMPQCVLAEEAIDSLAFFGEAAIAADHTGESNMLADLLQAQKFERDVECSLKSLQVFLTNGQLSPKVRSLLEEREAERELARKLVESGAFRQCGWVTYARLEKHVDMAFLPALLPEAHVIMTYIASKRQPGRFIVRLRLGKMGAGKIILNKLGIDGIDDRWHGRFNAGSNRRDPSGTQVPLREYLEFLNARIKLQLRA